MTVAQPLGPKDLQRLRGLPGEAWRPRPAGSGPPAVDGVRADTCVVAGSPYPTEWQLGQLDDAGLRVRSVLSGDEAVLSLCGELDAATARCLDEALQAVEPLGAPTIVLDLSGLRFIDSTGLNRLIVALKRQRLKGGEVVLRGVTAHVHRVLEIVGLLALFRIE